MDDKTVTVTLSVSDWALVLTAIDKEATFCRDEAYGEDKERFTSLANDYDSLLASITEQREAGRTTHTDSVAWTSDDGADRVVVNTTTTLELQLLCTEGWITSDNMTIYGVLTDAEIDDRKSVWTD